MARKGSKKKLDLVNNVRMRNEKSTTLKKEKGRNKSKERMLSPKHGQNDKKSNLKRIKSSAVLQ